MICRKDARPTRVPVDVSILSIHDICVTTTEATLTTDFGGRKIIMNVVDMLTVLAACRVSTHDGRTFPHLGFGVISS